MTGKISRRGFLATAGVALAAPSTLAGVGRSLILLDGSKTARIFEGIGALSAGEKTVPAAGRWVRRNFTRVKRHLI